MTGVKKSRFSEDEYWTPFRVVKEFHRGRDGFVGFGRTLVLSDGETRPDHLSSVRRDKLDVYKKDLKKMLGHGFFTIQSFWRHDDRKMKDSPIGPVCRRQSDLRYLNALYVDLDIANVNLTFREAKRLLFALVRKNRLPKPSILADSGRGMWAYWLLHDPNNKAMPPRGDPNPNKFGYNFRLWQRIEDELIRRLRRLGADPVAKDGARFTRFPGSVNFKANRRVAYRVLYPDPSERISYTLEDFATFVGVPLTEKPASKAKRVARKSDVPSSVRKQKRHARFALYKLRVAQLHAVAKSRGGFQEGTRENALLLLATWLKALGTPLSQTRREVIALGAQCQPPLDPKTCLRRVQAANPKKPMKDLTIATWLKITRTEKSELKLSWPSEDGYDAKPTPGGLAKKQTEINERRALCKALLRRRGGLSARKLVTLYAKHGFEVHAATAARDLLAI